MAMQKIVVLAIMSLLLVIGCQRNNEIEPPRNDFKVHTYYVVPADKSYSEDSANRVWRAIYEIQAWYQIASGGVTFEILDEENVIEVYFAERESSYYEGDWWNLLLKEMRDKGNPVQSYGTIAMLWIQGISQVTETAIALGGTSCEGNCGTAIMPMHTIVGPTWPIVDMGIAFHEMGHTFGLSHPVEKEDLPLPTEQLPILWSVMCQLTVRQGNSDSEHGFLTYEKTSLIANPFLKSEVNLYQNLSRTNIINYPETTLVPEPTLEYEMLDANTVRFSTDYADALLYYWNFSDGSTTNEISPTHSFNSNGLYNVSLLVTDDFGMAGRVNKYIEIK